MYALFKDGKQISKAHSTWLPALIEAFERKCVIVCHADFYGGDETLLPDGIEIKQLP